jgi:hypothetical protein
MRLSSLHPPSHTLVLLRYSLHRVMFSREQEDVGDETCGVHVHDLLEDGTRSS